MIWRPLHSCISETLTQHSQPPSHTHTHTHTSRGLHHKYLRCSDKTLFQKKSKFEGLLFVCFCWNVQEVLFFAPDCSTLSLCWLLWKAISLYICNEIDWCTRYTFHICPTMSYFSSAAVWNKNEIKIYLNIVLLLLNVCCQTWIFQYWKGPTFPFWEHRFQTLCEERDGHKIVN